MKRGHGHVLMPVQPSPADNPGMSTCPCHHKPPHRRVLDMITLSKMFGCILALMVAGSAIPLLLGAASPQPSPATAPIASATTKPTGPLEVSPAEINLTGARAR